MDAPFVVLIPARLQSTRLPNKPLADLGGRAMVVRVAERAKLSGAHQVVVATDSPEIIAVCAQYGVEAVLTRPDHENGTERLAEAASLLNLAPETIIVNVQGDEPMIDPELIRQVAQYLHQNPVPAATAAHFVHSAQDFNNPNVVKVVLNKRQEAVYFSRAPIPFPRDDIAAVLEGADNKLPPVLRHIGIYGYRAQFLASYHQMQASPLEQIEKLEQLRILWHGHAIGVVVTDNIPVAGVDTLEDLQRMQQHFQA